MELFSIFIIVIFIVLVAAIVFAGSGEFDDFQELSVSLDQRTRSLDN